MNKIWLIIIIISLIYGILTNRVEILTNVLLEAPGDALKLMHQYHISGIPIVEGKKLVGILTNRDLRFETDLDQKIADVMTKEKLITAPIGTKY